MIAVVAVYVQPALAWTAVGPLLVAIGATVDPERALLWQTAGFFVGGLILPGVYRKPPDEAIATG